MRHRFSRSDEATTKTNSRERLATHRTDVQRTFPLIQQHDAQSQDHGLASSLAEEIVQIGGGLVTVYLKGKSTAYDDVWEEDADPVYSSGIRLKAHFVPQPVEAQLTLWGIDTESKPTIIFAKEEVIREVGDRLIIVGDLVDVPYNAVGIKPDRYLVNNSFDVGNFRYNWLYWGCTCETAPNDYAMDRSAASDNMVDDV